MTRLDIIAGASLALGTLNLPESVVKARSWFPRRFLAPISASSKGIPSTKWPSADSVDQHHARRRLCQDNRMAGARGRG